MSLPARTTGMAYNPQTHHLFLAHARSFVGSYGPVTEQADNTVQVFDTASFGQAALISIDSPGPMTRLGGIVYVANSSDGSVSLIQDEEMPPPPPPTATSTPSPFPTLPPEKPTAMPTEASYFGDERTNSFS
jgi:DNA-binding beta-propeller fold protein YncE